MRSEAASHAQQGMPRLARRLRSAAGVTAATAEHSEHTSWLMLPCISTVCPGAQRPVLERVLAGGGRVRMLAYARSPSSSMHSGAPTLRLQSTAQPH